MRKLFLLAITMFAIILSGCQSGSSGNPKDVLTQFFKALSKKDVTEAKKYATKDSDGMLSMMGMGMNMNNGQNEHSDKMLEMMQNVKMSNPVINGDKATITVTDKKSGENTDFVLKKEDGKWKVAFDMTTLMDMANQKMKENGMGNMDSLKGVMNQGMDSMNAANPDMQKKMEQAQKMMDSAKNMMDKMK
ncbi:MAG: DUF4878 domain-containing protein [Ginsengibacter sp.]